MIVVVAAAWVSSFVRGNTLADAAGSHLLTSSAMAVAFSAFGALVLAHRPRHRIGLLFAAYGWRSAVSVACLRIRSGAFALSPGWDRAINLVGITVWIPAVALLLPLILQLFPMDRRRVGVASPIAPRIREPRWCLGVTCWSPLLG
jgi:two-component system, NarL family, sensor kinase